MGKTLLKDAWKEIWVSRYKRGQIIVSTVIMLIIAYTLPFFFNHIEKRKGVILNDWLLAQIPPHNVSIFIFSIIWGMTIFTVVRAIYSPSIYLYYCSALIFVILARIISISLVHLSPPVGLIPLTDPLTGIFYGEANITKDLFFSGHTATLTLMMLCLERKTDKLIGFFAVIIVAALLLVQHIHYTIDILASPVITYLCYRFTRYILAKLNKDEPQPAYVSNNHS